MSYMDGSDGHWGQLGTDPQREAWDNYERIPEPGQNPPLDSFLARKGLDDGALIRIGARLSAPHVLAFAYPGGIKFRDVVTDRRWAFIGSEFDLKIIRGGGDGYRPGERVIVVEGETDGARVTMLYPACDVALMPAGAMAWKPSYTEQVRHYRQVLVGLDADEAGDKGAAKVLEAIPHATRLKPGEANDWCSLDGDAPPLPDLPTDDELSARRRSGLRWANTIRIERLPWLWDGWIPQVGLTALSGEEGTGKSTVTCDLAAKITRGELDGELWGKPARVLFLTAEDTLEHVIGPRLIAAGADLSRVAFITDDLVLPDGASRIAELVAGEEAEGGGKIAAVVIDPISAFLDRKTDSHNDASTRAALRPLAQVSMDGQFAVIAVGHLNKSRSNDPREKLMGSTAFRSAPRATIVFGWDPDDPAGDSRVLVRDKANYAPHTARAIRVRIEGCEAAQPTADGGVIEVPTSRAVMLDECSFTAAQVIRAGRPGEEDAGDEKLREAVRFLEAALADGPRPTREVKTAAEEASISKATLRRAREALAVTASKDGYQGAWSWRLPSEEPAL
jgi:hypothetical protein